MKKTVKTLMTSLAASAVIFTGANAAFAHEDFSSTYVEAPKESSYTKVFNAMSKEDMRDLNAAITATAKFKDFSVAVEAGYKFDGPFAAIPAGGMGIHRTNFDISNDTILDPRQPENLLYEPQKDGRMKLVGIEYHVNADLVDKAPTLFGQTFDGPMLNHEIDTSKMTEEEIHELTHDRKNMHYDLHVWIWEHNPNGLFAMWNPNVADKSNGVLPE